MDAILIVAFLVFVGWICWRLFLRNWVMSIPIIHIIRGRFFASRIPDEAYYAQAAYEMRNKIISDGLWTKAWSDAQGDDVKAQALYIKYRVDDLRRQAAGKFSEYTREYKDDVGKTVVPCRQCGAKLRVAAGRYLDVRCPRCGASFRTMSPFPPLKISYGTHFARYIYAIGACIGIVMVYAIILSLVSEFLRDTTLAPLPRALIKTGLLFGTAWICVSAWKAIVKRNGK
jgi:DNA-directed RNA polymerase subunit RPC12/RpoP